MNKDKKVRFERDIGAVSIACGTNISHLKLCSTKSDESLSMKLLYLSHYLILLLDFV